MQTPEHQGVQGTGVDVGGLGVAVGILVAVGPLVYEH